MDFLFEPAPHEHALAFIKAKAPLRKDQFEKLLPELQALAFTVSGINAADALQDLRDTVATVPAGALVKDVRKQVAQKLAHYLDSEDLQGELIPETAEEADKRKHQLQTRANMLIRHHGNQAYATTVYQDLQENGDIFPFWKYLTVGDEHVRDSHRALDGVILPQDHEFWKTHYPPWEFGCRCQVVPVTRAEYESHQRSDAGREPHERDTLTEAQLEQLTNERTMLRKIGGEPVKIDLRAPREKIGMDHPYVFDPSIGFQPDLPSLRARYDDETWGAFEKFAKATHVPALDNKSVWMWLMRGRKGKAAALAMTLPAPQRKYAAPDLGAGGSSAPASRGRRGTRPTPKGRSYTELLGEAMETAIQQVKGMTRAEILDLARKHTDPAEIEKLGETLFIKRSKDLARGILFRQERERLWKKEIGHKATKPMAPNDDSDLAPLTDAPDGPARESERITRKEKP
jgi:SPP1 gp7 family putative phage head morphogenesis protein